MKPRLYSFDIFDTLITRTTATPTGIFALIEEKLKKEAAYADIPEFLRNNFYTIRTHTEATLRTPFFARGAQEISFEQIYRLIAENALLTEDQKNRLAQLELQTELAHVVGIDKNIERVRNLVNEGERVILISDMYLPCDEVRKLLLKADSIFEKLPIYISSEKKKTKFTGDLYREIQKIEKIEFPEWKHFGDNHHSDYTVALSLGICAEHYVYPRMEEYAWNSVNRNPNNSFVQLTVGASRYCKLPGKLGDMAQMGASLAGPMFFPYVWWVTENAQRMGLKHLYFVARDGYIFKEIADIIIGQRGLDIKTHYIYGSRKAWKLAGYTSNATQIRNDDSFSIDEFFWAVGYYLPDKYFWVTGSRNMKDLSQHLELSSEEISPFLPDKYRDFEQSLTSQDFREIKNILFANPKFVALFEEKTKALRKKINNYLQQEIDFSNEKIAFVELRGTGRTQDCLANIIAEEQKNKIYSFFLTLDANGCFSDGIKIMLSPTEGRHSLDNLEILTRAPHGQTVGYEIKCDKVVPVLDEKEGQSIINAGFYEYLEGIKAFTTRYCQIIQAHKLYPVDLQLYKDYFLFLVNHPDRKTAELIGQIPFQTRSDDKNIDVYAPPFTQRELIWWGLSGWRPKQMYWETGRWARTPKGYAELLARCRKMRDFCRKYIYDFCIRRDRKTAFIKIFGLKMNLERFLGIH